MAKPNLPLGIFSAIIIIFIWSGFLVFSRSGVNTNLTAYDIAALRFMVAGAMVLPFCKAWWPGHLPLKAKVLMSLCGPGAVYSMIMYSGLSEASAAYGGVSGSDFLCYSGSESWPNDNGGFFCGHTGDGGVISDTGVR